MALSVIYQAKRLLAHKKYNEVVRLLEPHVLEYRDSFAFHFYIGLSYLNLGEMGNAKDYFTTARKLKPNDADLMAATAVMALRRHDTGKAVEYYLRILDMKPSYELAKKGLSSIRKYNNADAMGDFISTGKIKTLYPKPSLMEFYAKYIKIGIFFLILALIIVVPVLFIYPMFKNKMPRKDIHELDLTYAEKKDAVDTNGVFKNILLNSQVLEAYANAQKAFQTYHDNIAQVEINKILNSNASSAIRQKALALQDLLKEPRFDTIKDIFTYKEVEKEPYLYNDCYVIWKGLPANIVKGEEKTKFELLVGYDTIESLDGKVIVYCKSERDIEVGKVITVLAQIKITEEDKITLRAITIHQSAKPLEIE